MRTSRLHGRGPTAAHSWHAAVETVAELVHEMTDRRDGVPAARVVLTGQPNVGKSSLLNALVGRAAALTSERPGHDPRLRQRPVRPGWSAVRTGRHRRAVERRS